MKNYNILSKINTYLKVLGGTIGIASGFVLAAFFLLKLHFRLISVVSIIISEYKNAKDITGINALNLIFIMLIFSGILLIGLFIPLLIKGLQEVFRIKKGFNEINIVKQRNDEIEYGIIHGNNTIVFIKVGLKGSIYGYKNKYLRIAKKLNKEHGCTVIVASNPNGYLDDFDCEMKSLKAYAYYHKWNNYQVYYMGHSNGASLGIINAYKYPEIKKLVCINSPLMINPQKLIEGIKQFNGCKMYLIYGNKDPSSNMLELFTKLESDKIKTIIFIGADHNFQGGLNCFIDLPDKLFFHDTEFDNFVNVRTGINIFPVY